MQGPPGLAPAALQAPDHRNATLPCRWAAASHGRQRRCLLGGLRGLWARGKRGGFQSGWIASKCAGVVCVLGGLLLWRWTSAREDALQPNKGQGYGEVVGSGRSEADEREEEVGGQGGGGSGQGPGGAQLEDEREEDERKRRLEERDRGMLGSAGVKEGEDEEVGMGERDRERTGGGGEGERGLGEGGAKSWKAQRGGKGGCAGQRGKGTNGPAAPR